MCDELDSIRGVSINVWPVIDETSHIPNDILEIIEDHYDDEDDDYDDGDDDGDDGDEDGDEDGHYSVRLVSVCVKEIKIAYEQYSSSDLDIAMNEIINRFGELVYYEALSKLRIPHC